MRARGRVVSTGGRVCTQTQARSQRSQAQMAACVGDRQTRPRFAPGGSRGVQARRHIQLREDRLDFGSMRRHCPTSQFPRAERASPTAREKKSEKKRRCKLEIGQMKRIVGMHALPQKTRSKPPLHPSLATARLGAALFAAASSAPAPASTAFGVALVRRVLHGCEGRRVMGEMCEGRDVKGEV